MEVAPTLIYSVLEKKNEIERADIAEWYDISSRSNLYTPERTFGPQRHKVLPELLKSGKLRAHNIEHKKGGLAAIPEGLEELKQGKVSGKKLVYKL